MMKMLSAVALMMVAVTVSAHTEAEYQAAFTKWMQANKKSYSSEDFSTRYGIFKSNMDYVDSWNAQGSSTILGLTIFADLTNQEYQKIYLGTHIDATERLSKAVKSSVNVNDAPYNSTVDWRTKGIVTDIKNQGQCGSCWSFSTTGSTEGAHAQKTGNLVSLSEQNLMDCSTAQGNQGCDGGLMDDAFQYIISNNGIDTEASYPYQGVDGTCAFNPANVGATISSYTDVTSGDEGALLTATNSQVVSVAIDASHISFQLYTKGVYHYILCSQTKLDHGVLVVGYGVDSDNDEKYWIVKNSWGSSWGQAGYIYMSRDRDNNCGIATSASYPTV